MRATAATTKVAVTLALLGVLSAATTAPALAYNLFVTTDAEVNKLAKKIGPDGVLENITIAMTADVTDLTPLSGLRHIKGGGLWMGAGSPDVELERGGYERVRNGTNLASFAPLKNLRVIDQNMTVGRNVALASLSLPALTEVGGGSSPQ